MHKTARSSTAHGIKSLLQVTKYVFVHDHQNYRARLLSLYITTMQETESQYPDLWAEFVKGITQNEKTLARFFPIALDLSQLLHAFAAEYGRDNNAKRTRHHEITGGKLSRMMNNSRKRTGEMYSVNMVTHSCIRDLHRPVPVRGRFRFDQVGHVSLEPGGSDFL